MEVGSDASLDQGGGSTARAGCAGLSGGRRKFAPDRRKVSDRQIKQINVVASRTCFVERTGGAVTIDW
jgi:hypothetical protein